MKVKLIIPKFQKLNESYYPNQVFKDRLKVLEQAFLNNDIDLVVTSHNYFCFGSDFKSYSSDDIKKFINNCLITILNPLKNKKPIILGLDFCFNINPFIGINALVCFLEVDDSNGNYIYKTHIWECWKDQTCCSSKCFSKQNHKRFICFKDQEIGLLSCGDIANDCHEKGELLKNCDLYIDLSHASLTGHTSQAKIPDEMISKGKSRYVIVTQQVSGPTTILNYKKDGYKYIFPQDTTHQCVKRYCVNGKIAGVFVDIEIVKNIETIT